MHILIIPSEEYIPIDKPTAGIFQHDQARILKEKNNKVGALSFSFKYSIFSLIKAVLAIKNKRTKNINLPHLLVLIFQQIFIPLKSSLTHETIDGIDIFRCEGGWGIKRNSHEMSLYQMWIRYGDFSIRNYISTHGKPDVIHAHNIIYAGLLATFIKKKYDIPIVITEHSSQYSMQYISPLLNSKIKECLNNNLNVFTVGAELKLQLEKKYDIKTSNLKVLPNVIDPRIEATALQKSTPKKSVSFLNIGNLIPLKGQEELIRAFAKAFKSKEDVTLIIIGEGYLETSLNQTIIDLNLSTKIRLVGLKSRKEIINYIDSCDVFVLPSHYETFGVVLIEALSRGKPVISTFCGGPESIVNKSNGLLVVPKNIEELSEALKKMYLNYSTYKPHQIRSNLIDSYGKEVFYKKVEKIYESAIKS